MEVREESVEEGVESSMEVGTRVEQRGAGIGLSRGGESELRP